MSDEGTPTPFIELPTSYCVFAVMEIRQRLDELLEEGGVELKPDQPLSDQGEAWLRRMRSALCDTDTSTSSVKQMTEAFLEALPEAEGLELDRRLREFELIRDMVPLTATSTKEAMPAVLRGLSRWLEANAAATT